MPAAHQPINRLLRRAPALLPARRGSGLAGPFLSAHRAFYLLAACGLRIVRTTEQTFDESYIDALRTLAQLGLSASRKTPEFDE